MRKSSSWSLEVGLYLAITFGITWSLAIAVLGFPVWFEARFGALSSSSPVFYIAVWAPNVAALVLTGARGGWPALVDLGSRFFRWRVSPWVWVAAIGFYPALMVIVQLVGLYFGQPVAGSDAWLAALGGVFNVAALALGPVGEELGWRGYLLPRVLAKFAPVTAALVVGAIWMVWHIPAFLVSGLPQSGMAIPVFMVGGLALSVFVTAIYVNARESILVAGVIPHAIVNACGEAMGGMTWIHGAVLALGALALVLVAGRDLRGRPTERLA